MNNRELEREREREITPAVARWLRSVEARCWELAGCSISDMMDRDWSLLFDEGLSPREAVERAMEDAD